MITVELICAVAGPMIAFLVSVAKRWTFVERHPKIVALSLSILTSAVGGYTGWGLDWAGIVACTLVPFASAVTTYEVVKSATKEPTTF